MVRALELQPASLLYMDAVWSPRSCGTQWSYHRSTHVCIPLQAKDSDDDDDVTVTVDRDRFMDEFFEQVGASTLHLSPYTGRPWVTMSHF